MNNVTNYIISNLYYNKVIYINFSVCNFKIKICKIHDKKICKFVNTYVLILLFIQVVGNMFYN